MRRSTVGIILVLTLGCLVASHAAEAQQPGKVYRIGVLGAGYAAAAINGVRLENLRLGLRELGYVEGQNLSLEVRSPEGRAERLAALADELETHVPEVPLPRFVGPGQDGPPPDENRPLGGAMPFDVVVGPFNPLALPVVLDFEPPKAIGRAAFNVAYEGAPGCVHGAVLAATFDIILTAANAIVGAVGPTVRLATRYLRPTLCDEEAVFEGWVTDVTDRRVLSKGRIVQGGIVTVEANGEFAIFNHEAVHRMAAARRTSFEAGAKWREVTGGDVK